MSCQNCLLGYKNVALIAPRVGERAFVEDHNSVIQVTVNIIYLEVGVGGVLIVF